MSSCNDPSDTTHSGYGLLGYQVIRLNVEIPKTHVRPATLTRLECSIALQHDDKGNPTARLGPALPTNNLPHRLLIWGRSQFLPILCLQFTSLGRRSNKMQGTYGQAAQLSVWAQ